MTRRLVVVDGAIRVEGAFDLVTAVRAAAAARGHSPRSRLTVDLSRARIDDIALAAFVREVTGRPVTLVGLSRHHERLLRYLEEEAPEAQQDVAS